MYTSCGHTWPIFVDFLLTWCWKSAENYHNDVFRSKKCKKCIKIYVRESAKELFKNQLQVMHD